MAFATTRPGALQFLVQYSPSTLHQPSIQPHQSPGGLRFWHCMQPAPHEEHVLPVRNVPCRHAEQTPVVTLHTLQLALQPNKSRQKDSSSQQQTADSVRW